MKRNLSPRCKKKVRATLSLSLSWQRHLILGARALRRSSGSSGSGSQGEIKKEGGFKDVILREEQKETCFGKDGSCGRRKKDGGSTKNWKVETGGGEAPQVPLPLVPPQQQQQL